MQTEWPWVKIWTKGILKGSVVAQLSTHEQLIWVKLLCMAGESPVRGVLCRAKDIPYSIPEIAHYITEPVDVVQSTIDKCMADSNDPARHNGNCGNRMSLTNGFYSITNWSDYQSNTTSKKLRETPQERALREQRLALRYIREHPEDAAFKVTEKIVVDSKSGEIIETTLYPNVKKGGAE